ncbi:uncharacterized mitochondrial protein-like protein [Tanacetum coccineum]
MTITLFGMTPKAIEELVNRRVEEALAAYEAIHAANALEVENQIQNGSDGDNGNGGNRDGGNGNGGNGNGGNGNPNENGREKYQVKYATCTLLNSALTWWNSHKRTIRTEAAFAMSWRELMKLMAERFQELTMMCTKMVPKEEDRVEKFIGGLLDNIQGNVIAAGPMVMASPNIPISVEENFRDPIEIRVDVVHPAPVAVVAFSAATIMRTLAQHEEAIQGIQEHLLGVPIQKELTALRFRVDVAEAENASLRGIIRTMEAVETVTRNHERLARMDIKRQLASVQESQRQDREDFRKLKELVTRFTRDALLHYDAEMELMNLILLSIPNEIYNSVDACTSAKDMWKRVERLMRGTIQNKVDRQTLFTNEFDQFVAEPGEVLVSVYNHFAQLMNDLERNDMHFPIVTINTKFLNSLQPEWLKYDYPKVQLAKQPKKLEKSHDPLALVAHTGSSSRNTSSYYVTHPTSVVDYEDEYQQDDVHTNSEDPLTSAMLLLARAITQNFSTPTNNRLRTSSNTRNQAIIQGDRVNIQSRNSGNAGRNNRRAYVQEEIIEGSNAPNETGNVQRTLRTSSSGNTSTVQCYNYSGKGHYARNCPKPRVRDSKYFMEQMLLAKQDEAGVILTDEQNDFLFADASRMEEIEELSANICLMARIQPADNTSDAGPSYDSAFISKVQSSSNTENEEQMYPTHTKIINSTIGDDQIDSDIIFDSPNGIVNNGSIEKDTRVPDLYIIRDLEKQRGKLDLDVKDYKQKNEELQKTLSILKRQMSENKYRYHDTVLDLEAKLKKNVDLILKLGNSLQGMFMLGPKPLSVYDQQLKHSLGIVGQLIISLLPRNYESKIPGTRLDPNSDKESPEVEITNDEEVEITNVGIPMNVNEEEEEITNEVFLSRKSFDTLVDHLQEVMVESFPNMVDTHIKEQVKKQVPEQVRDQVLVNIQAEIYSQIQKAIDNHIPSQVDASVRSYMSGHILHVHPVQSQTPSVPEQQYQLLQVNENEQGPLTLENQEQEDNYDFWTESYASDDDEIPTKQMSQDIMEEVSLTIDEAKLKKMVDEMLRQRCTSGDEHQYHIDQMKNFLKSDIIWETPPLSLINQDLLYLKKGSSGPEKIVLSLYKFPAIIFNGDDIEERTSRWPDYKNLNKNDIEDMYLLIMNGKVLDYEETGLLCYQQKVNLTAPTISFPGVEKHKMFSIIYEPVHGIIYKNSKKEKRVMRHSEIHKFCDATLNRVLEGLRSYNNDVKYGYIQRDLTNEEVEYLKLFEEEIEVRLKYRNQMRRWEMYVNGRPLGPRRERPE